MDHWSRIRLALGLFFSLVLLTGCPPEFEDDVCSTDEDCFVGEVCNTTTNSCELAVIDVQPTITSFSASPNPAQPNSEVTISWQTDQALTGRLSDVNGTVEALTGAELAEGSYTFTIGTESRSFTLSVQNGENSAMESLEVTIDPPVLAIPRFEATPNPVEPGALLTLVWETENAESGRIITPDADYMIPTEELESGEWQTTIEQSSQFTLAVTSIVGETLTQDVMVAVEGGEPLISEFSASESAIVSGDSVELTWDTTAAASIEIVDGDGNVIPTTGEAPTGGSVSVSPTDDAEYTLTATNEFGESTATTTVSVEQPLNITSFTAGQSQITEGDSVMLGWSVAGDSPTLALTDNRGNTIDITGQSVTSGAVNVSPTQTTTYTLAASTALQNDSAQVTITVVVPPPTINSFTATPDEVVIGGTTTLAWDITGASSIAITNDLGTTIPTAGKAVTTDSLAVNLNTTRTFTLRATNAGGFTERQVTVVAGNAVAITNFSGSPNAISPGQSVTLSWTTANADGLDLESDQGDTIDLTGTAIASDSVTVSPTTTTVYTLTATGLSGPVSRDVTITVQPAVAITSFDAAPTTVVAGDPVTLTWATTDAASIQITFPGPGGTPQLVNTVGLMVSGDSVTVNPTADTTYTLSADGFQGPVTQTASVVVQQPVAITSFVTDRSAVAPGEPATLTWAVDNAASVAITDSSGGAVDLTGTTTAGDSVAVTPTANETYTITASGPGGPVTSQVQVDVVDPDGLTINEILVDPTGTNDSRQWIELTNTGNTILDLSQFALGAGAVAYNEALVQLSGTLAPGGCVVVGGPTSDPDNGSPAFDVSADFAPDLPLAGGAALFVGPVAEQSDTRTPVASIVWGGSNPNGLLDVDGTAKTVLAPVVTEGSSLTRTTSSDALALASPTPGQCVHLEALAPSVGSNQASGTVAITGFGMDVALDTFSVGTDALTGCAATATGVECTLPTSSQTGSQDLVVSRVNEYIDDGSGGLTTSPLTTPIDAVLTGAYFYEGELPDPGASFYCGITGASATPVAVGTDVVVTLQVFLSGETDVNGVLPSGYVVEALEFAGGVLPQTIFDASWGAVTAGPQVGNDATFTATFSNAAPTVSEIAFRVSPDSGANWYYCDTNASSGSDDGYQIGGGQVVTWQ